jgi:TrmH family RNA methyltransferase
MAFTKNQAKLIKSLHEKKNRSELGLFLVEGAKSVSELLKSDFTIDLVLTTNEFFEKYGDLIREKSDIYEIVDKSEIEKVSTFETNDSTLAVVKQKPNTQFEIGSEVVIALDDIKDPGNLGTIIRIADWYGVHKIIASKTTADFYNSKVISASMGSFTRVHVFYTDLKEFLSKTKLPIFGASLHGENIHKTKFHNAGILLMGNESKGISNELETLITKKITIPSYGEAESLNVGVATAVILGTWKQGLE